MFNNIIGTENNKKILTNNINSNNVSHSYIFSGIEGVGKLLFAKEFAKAILCTNDVNKPCNKCKSCETFDNLNNPYEIMPMNKQAEMLTSIDSLSFACTDLGLYLDVNPDDKDALVLYNQYRLKFHNKIRWIDHMMLNFYIYKIIF